MHVAQADSNMAGREDAAVCLKRSTCQPLGGHSIWASLPRLPTENPALPPRLPVILVLAGMDGGGLFHDLIKVDSVPYLSLMLSQMSLHWSSASAFGSDMLSHVRLRVLKLAWTTIGWYLSWFPLILLSWQGSSLSLASLHKVG